MLITKIARETAGYSAWLISLSRDLRCCYVLRKNAGIWFSYWKNIFVLNVRKVDTKV